MYVIKVTLNQFDTKILFSLIEQNQVEEEIFKELITDRLIEKEEPVSMDLLIQVMDSLELEQLMMIIHSKENTFYGDMALSSYDKKCMEVDNDVYQELVLKLKQDMEEY